MLRRSNSTWKKYAGRSVSLSVKWILPSYLVIISEKKSKRNHQLYTREFQVCSIACFYSTTMFDWFAKRKFLQFTTLNFNNNEEHLFSTTTTTLIRCSFRICLIRVGSNWDPSWREDPADDQIRRSSDSFDCGNIFPPNFCRHEFYGFRGSPRLTSKSTDLLFLMSLKY